MSGILGMFGGGASDPYGDLLTADQRRWAQTQGLLRMAAAFAKAGEASRLPVSLGGAFGNAAEALAAGQQDAAKTALDAMLTGQKVQDLKSTRALRDKIVAYNEQFLKQQGGAGDGGGAIDTRPRGLVPTGQPVMPTLPGAGSLGPPAPGSTFADKFIAETRPGLLGPSEIPEIGVPTVADGGYGVGGALAPRRRTPIPDSLTPGQTGPVLPPGGMPAASGGASDEWTYNPQTNRWENAGDRAARNEPGGGDGGYDDAALAPRDRLYSPGGGGGLLPSLTGGTSASPFGGGGIPSEWAGSPFTRQAQAGTAGAPGSRDPLDIIAQYESGGRNIEQQVIGPQGGYNPSVGRVTGPSSASGPWQMIDPTWRAAASKAGVDISQYPRAIDAPVEVQRAVAQQLFNEQGYAPWAPYNRNLAAAVGYTGGERQPGGPDTVYNPNAPNLPITRVQSPGGVGGPGGQALIPGTNMTPQQAAAINAMARAGGIPAPFEDLLNFYYKSPEYLGNIERQNQQIGLEFTGPKAAATAEATKATELKYAEQLAAATSRGNLPSQIVLKTIEAQNDLRNRLAPLGFQVTFDRAGVGTASKIAGAEGILAGTAAATTRAQEQAKADVAAGTAPDLAGRTTYAQKVAEQDTTARQLAIAAHGTLYLLDDARQLLEGSGIFSGITAGAKTTAAQWLAAAGLPNDRLVNTQTYLQQAGARAAEILRSGAYGAGTGISQQDLKAADRLAAGDNTVELATLKRILDLTEKTARRNIDIFNDRAKKRDPTSMVPQPPRFIGMSNKGGRVYQLDDGSTVVKD